MLAELVSSGFFAAQASWILWLVTGVSIALLAFGGDRAVSAAAALARLLGIPKAIVGATIVSLGTTTPEMCVSVGAALRGDPDLALGNAVGSIIVDTGLIFGLCCVIRRLPMDKFVLNRHGWIQLGVGALLTLACAAVWLVGGDIGGVVLPRAFGVLLVALLIWYLYASIKWSRRHPMMLPLDDDGGGTSSGRAHASERTPGKVLLSLLLLAAGLALVVVGSDVLIGSVRVLCERYEVPPSVLAVTLVAFGTSLPELVTGLAALIKGHEDLSVGNIIGADILNVLFVTGIANTAVPLRVDPAFFYLYLPAMMVVLLLFRGYGLFGKKKFHRWQGVPLLAAYAVFVYLTVRLGLV